MKKTIQTPAFQNLYDDFDNLVKVRNYQVGSGQMYQTAIREFLIWIEEIGINKIKSVTSREMVKYYEYLTIRPKYRGYGVLADSTVKFHLFAIGLFMENLLLKKEIDNGFYIPSVGKSSKIPRNYLSVEEIKILYQCCQNDLERALLAVAYGCGLRRSEIRALDVKEVQLSSGMLVVRKGKGSKRRDVPMSDGTVQYLRKYITEERDGKLSENHFEEAFLINDKGKRMNGHNLNKTLKKIIEQTGNNDIIQKDITLHCLRHSIACHLGENNAGIDFIRGFLGHAQINTTSLYAIKNKKKKPVVTF